MSHCASFLLMCITLTSTISLSATETKQKSPFKACSAADNSLVFGASTPPIDLLFFIDPYGGGADNLEQAYHFYSRLACFFVDFNTKATGKHRVALTGYDDSGRLPVDFKLGAQRGRLQSRLRAMTRTGDDDDEPGSFADQSDLCYALDYVNRDDFNDRRPPRPAVDGGRKAMRLLLVAWRAGGLVVCDQEDGDERFTLDDRLSGASRKTDLVVVTPKGGDAALRAQAHHLHQLAGLATGWEADTNSDANVTALVLAIRQIAAAQHEVNHRKTTLPSTTTTTTAAPLPMLKEAKEERAPDKLEAAPRSGQKLHNTKSGATRTIRMTLFLTALCLLASAKHR